MVTHIKRGEHKESLAGRATHRAAPKATTQNIVRLCALMQICEPKITPKN
jgi:hypothetical protein